VRLGKLAVFLEMIKFEHTVFALPFAYVGALLSEQRLPSLHDFVWITLAMIGARTAAMSLNRIIDRHIDAANPRTAARALPRGLLPLRTVWLYTALSLLLLAVAAYNLSPLAFRLFPVAVIALTFYSYTKRFTWLCHLFLGGTLALAPLGAWVAITGAADAAALTLAAAVMVWVAGFDIIYACDDYDFDRTAGIYSIPARFGIGAGLRVAKFFHVLAAALFVLFGYMLGLGLFYWLGVAAAALLLFWQHRLISPADLSRAGVAFFNLNGSLSVVMLAAVIVDVVFGR
jgi:4-hydroxybenzoate polyprenyltransferase